MAINQQDILNKLQYYNRSNLTPQEDKDKIQLQHALKILNGQVKRPDANEFISGIANTYFPIQASRYAQYQASNPSAGVPGQGSTGGGFDLNNPGTFTADSLRNDPGFQFELEQGQRAINNAASASGVATSPNRLEQLATFSQNLAFTRFNDRLNTFLKANQQGFDQYATKRQLDILSQSNLFNQKLSNQNLALTQQNQAFNQGITRAGLLQSLQNQGFNQGLSLANLDLLANQQQYNQIAGLVGSGQDASGLLSNLNNQSASLQSSALQNLAGNLGNLNNFTTGANLNVLDTAGSNLGNAQLAGANLALSLV